MTDDEIMAHWQLAEGTTDMRADLVSFARAIIAQARAELIAGMVQGGPEAYKWRTAARTKTGTPGPWHLSLEPFKPLPQEVDEIACYAIPKE